MHWGQQACQAGTLAPYAFFAKMVSFQFLNYLGRFHSGWRRNRTAQHTSSLGMRVLLASVCSRVGKTDHHPSLSQFPAVISASRTRRRAVISFLGGGIKGHLTIRTTQTSALYRHQGFRFSRSARCRHLLFQAFCDPLQPLQNRYVRPLALWGLRVVRPALPRHARDDFPGGVAVHSHCAHCQIA